MGDPSEQKLEHVSDKTVAASDIFDAVLGSYGDSYKDLSETWRHIDSKAQSVLGASGILVGALVAFAKSGGSAHLPAAAVMALMVLLGACVLLALMALWIRSVPAPPTGQELEGLARDLVGASVNGDVSARYLDYLRQRMKAWSDVVRKVSDANSSKAWCVLLSQCALAVAVLVGVVLVIVRLRSDL